MQPWRYVGVGLLALLFGPLLGLLLGKAGVVYGVSGTARYLAGRMGSRESQRLGSAWVGMLTVMIPALAAGLPARWIAEHLFYNRHLTGWEQVWVSAWVLLLFVALGAIAGMLGRELKRETASRRA